MIVFWTIIYLVVQSSVVDLRVIHPVCRGMGGIGVVVTERDAVVNGVSQRILHTVCLADSRQFPGLREHRAAAIRVKGEGMVNPKLPVYTMILLLDESPFPPTQPQFERMCRKLGGTSVVGIGGDVVYDYVLHPAIRYLCWP